MALVVKIKAILRMWRCKAKVAPPAVSSHSRDLAQGNLTPTAAEVGGTVEFDMIIRGCHCQAAPRFTVFM